MIKRRITKKYQSPTFKLYSAAKMVKKLKEHDNFNLEYVKELRNLNFEDLIERLDISYINSLSDDRRAAWKKKGDKIVFKICEKYFDYNLEGIIEIRENILELAHWSNHSKEDIPAIQCLVKEFLKQDLSYDDLKDFSYDNITFEKTCDEYISVSSRASVWTDYIQGEILYNGKVWKSDRISYNVNVNAL